MIKLRPPSPAPLQAGNIYCPPQYEGIEEGETLKIPII